jgi:hypothetical protein
MPLLRIQKLMPYRYWISYRKLNIDFPAPPNFTEACAMPYTYTLEMKLIVSRCPLRSLPASNPWLVDPNAVAYNGMLWQNIDSCRHFETQAPNPRTQGQLCRANRRNDRCSSLSQLFCTHLCILMYLVNIEILRISKEWVHIPPSGSGSTPSIPSTH